MNQWCGTVLAAVANGLWPAMALVLGTWLALRFARQLNAATRHLIWWGVLAAIAAMPAAPGLLRIPHSIPADPLPEASVPRTFIPDIAATAAPIPGNSTGVIAPVRTGGIFLRAGAWPERIFGVWLTVLLLQLIRIAWSYAYLRRIKRQAAPAAPQMRRNFDTWMLACGIHRPARLLLSQEIVSPIAVGFRSPAVILPEALCADFSESELDHVLLHELAHMARRDDWTNLAWRFLWALLALHPVAAWVLRQIEREREIACDDWVVAATGEARPYAASLARLFEVCFTRRRVLLASGMVERGSQLGDRIAMLLRRQREFKPRASALSVALCMAAIAGFLALAAQTPSWIALAQDAPQPPAAPTRQAASSSRDSLPRAGQGRSAAPKAARASVSQDAVPAQTTPPAAAARAPSPAQARTSFLDALVAAGYGNLSVDDIIALKSNGISAEFLNGIRASNWSGLNAHELIELHNHGVSPQFLSGIRAAGLSGLSVQDLIALQSNGVDPAWVKEVETAGLGSYTAAQLVDFRRSGVPADLLRALKDAGFRNLEPRDIIQLRQSGVGRSNLQEARQYGSSLSIRQIIRLKQAGVI